MQAQAKDRIGVISHITPKVVHLVGFGVYEGDEPPLPGEDPLPKLVLDTGETVFGCACCTLWGPEKMIEKIISSYRDNGADLKVGVIPVHSAHSSGIN